MKYFLFLVTLYIEVSTILAETPLTLTLELKKFSGKLIASFDIPMKGGMSVRLS